MALSGINDVESMFEISNCCDDRNSRNTGGAGFVKAMREHLAGQGASTQGAAVQVTGENTESGKDGLAPRVVYRLPGYIMEAKDTGQLYIQGRDDIPATREIIYAAPELK